MKTRSTKSVLYGLLIAMTVGLMGCPAKDNQNQPAYIPPVAPVPPINPGMPGYPGYPGGPGTGSGLNAYGKSSLGSIQLFLNIQDQSGVNAPGQVVFASGWVRFSPSFSYGCPMRSDITFPISLVSGEKVSSNFYNLRFTSPDGLIRNLTYSGMVLARQVADIPNVQFGLTGNVGIDYMNPAPMTGYSNMPCNNYLEFGIN